MIAIESVSKRFKRVEALKGVSLDIEEGEFFGLLGPNGAGKSTLMNILSGYLEADEGSASLDGQPLNAANEKTRLKMGLVPQSISLYEDLSALQNLEIFGKLYQLPSKSLKERMEFWLNKVQLWERRNDKVKTFSGGMKRRVNLVSSLLHEPKILMCDEPTVGVDPQSRNAIFEFLEEQNAVGLTIIYTTHYMEEVERLCSRIAIIDNGEIIGLGTREELMAKLPFEDEVEFAKEIARPSLLEAFRALGEVEPIKEKYQLRVKPNIPMSRIHQIIEDENLSHRQFQFKQPTLEAVFLSMTGRSLRE